MAQRKKIDFFILGISFDNSTTVFDSSTNLCQWLGPRAFKVTKHVVFLHIRTLCFIANTGEKNCLVILINLQKLLTYFVLLPL